MRAAVLISPGKVEIQNVPVPQTTGRMVRVRLEGCGVCGSNLPPWEGRPWFQYPFAPGEPGHEGWGWVDAIGPEVSSVRVGERVAILSYRSYAEYDVALEPNVVPLPVALKNTPFPGEALGCAWNVFRRANVAPGQWVAIVGIGFLGAVLTQLAVRNGAKVIAVSRRPFALETARRLGAVATLPMSDTAAAISAVKELTAGAWCDSVIEAVGQQGSLDLASELTRERGRLVIAGYHQDGLRHVNMQLWNWRGLDVINAHERDPLVYIDGIRQAVRAVEQGQLDPTPFLTHRFRLEETGDAFEAMRLRPDDFMKAVVLL